MVSAETPGAVSSIVSVTPGPVAGTVPIRIDSAASRACAFSMAAVIAATGGLQLCQRALQVGHLGVQRGFPLLQRIQQHQQVGRPCRLQ